MDLYSSLFGLEYGFLNNKFYDPQKHAGTDKYISEKQNVIINGLIKFCESKKRARSIEKIYDYLISIKAEKECENFYKIKYDEIKEYTNKKGIVEYDDRLQ